MTAWTDAFFHCHRISAEGAQLVAWPDGGPYLQQEEILIDAFAEMRAEMNEQIKHELQQLRKQG